jgi:hypothetical protein
MRFMRVPFSFASFFTTGTDAPCRAVVSTSAPLIAFQCKGQRFLATGWFQAKARPKALWRQCFIAGSLSLSREEPVGAEWQHPYDRAFLLAFLDGPL